MNILYFGFNEQSYAPKTIISGARQIGISVFFVNIDNIFFKNNKIYYNNKILNIQKYQAAIVRCHSKVINGIQINNIATYHIIKLLHKNNIKILNGTFFLSNPLFDKFSQEQLFLEQNIPSIPTIHPVDNELLLKDDVIPWKFPIIIKEINGSFGLSVFKILNKSDLQKFVDKNTKANIIVQKFIPNTCDYRVLVCGGKAIGAMKRIGSNNSWKHNFSQGALVESYSNKKMETFCELVAKKLKCDFVGIDIIKDTDDNFLVVEVNLSANFKGFEIVYTNNMVGKAILKTLQNNNLY